jgi:hypothetical protein
MTKFKVWESQQLFALLTLTEQIRHGIDELLASDRNLDVGDLPDSTISTPLLYNLVENYRLLYNELEKSAIIRTGNSTKHLH